MAGSPRRSQGAGSPRRALAAGSPRRVVTAGSPRRALAAGSPRRTRAAGSSRRALVAGLPRRSRLPGSSRSASGLTNYILPKRGTNGRFTGSSNASPSKFKRAERQKQKAIIRSSLKKQLLEGFLEKTFLRGTDSDFIPARQTEGPFYRLWNSLFEKSYLFGPSRIGKHVRHFYFEGDKEKAALQSNIPRILARAADDESQVPTRIPVFVGRRFPIPSRHATEMEPLQEWLDFAFQDEDMKKAFKVKSAQEAYSRCLEIFQSYKYKDGRAAYVYYPLASPVINTGNIEESIAAPCRAAVFDRNALDEVRDAARSRIDICGTCGSTPATTYPSQEAFRNSEASTERIAQNGNDQINGSAGAELTSEGASDVFEAETSLLIETALDDTAFLALCLALDESSDSKLAFVATTLFDKKKSDELSICPLLKDILTYARMKKSKRSEREQREFQNLENSLKSTKECLEAVRLAHGLKRYDEMRWSFLLHKMKITAFSSSRSFSS